MLKAGALASLTTIVVYTVTAWAVFARELLLVAMWGPIFLVMDALTVALVTTIQCCGYCQLSRAGLKTDSRHGNGCQVALVALRQQSIYPNVCVAMIEFG